MEQHYIPAECREEFEAYDGGERRVVQLAVPPPVVGHSCFQRCFNIVHSVDIPSLDSSSSQYTGGRQPTATGTVEADPEREGQKAKRTHKTLLHPLGPRVLRSKSRILEPGITVCLENLPPAERPQLHKLSQPNGALPMHSQR